MAVNTPAGADGRVDLSAVLGAVRSALAAGGRPLFVIKSTVPPGTTAALEALVRLAGSDSPVVANPEFLREGRAVADFLVPDRVVIGARDKAAGDAVAALYDALDAPVIRCAPEDAELAKYAANSFLAALISLINELSAVADAVGADVGSPRSWAPTHGSGTPFSRPGSAGAARVSRRACSGSRVSRGRSPSRRRCSRRRSPRTIASVNVRLSSSNMRSTG